MSAALLAVLATGCDGLVVSPALPSGPLAGAWVGWFSSISTGLKTASVTLFHTGSVVSGFWTILDPVNNESMFGELVGTEVGSTALLTLQRTDSDGCSLEVVALVTSTALEGTWSTPDACGMQDVGTFRLTRQ